MNEKYKGEIIAVHQCKAPAFSEEIQRQAKLEQQRLADAKELQRQEHELERESDKKTIAEQVEFERIRDVVVRVLQEHGLI